MKVFKAKNEALWKPDNSGLSQFETKQGFHFCEISQNCNENNGETEVRNHFTIIIVSFDNTVLGFVSAFIKQQKTDVFRLKNTWERLFLALNWWHFYKIITSIFSLLSLIKLLVI